jgi:hypothetical protein
MDHCHDPHFCAYIKINSVESRPLPELEIARNVIHIFSLRVPKRVKY